MIVLASRRWLPIFAACRSVALSKSLRTDFLSAARAAVRSAPLLLFSGFYGCTGAKLLARISASCTRIAENSVMPANDEAATPWKFRASRVQEPEPPKTWNQRSNSARGVHEQASGSLTQTSADFCQCASRMHRRCAGRGLFEPPFLRRQHHRFRRLLRPALHDQTGNRLGREPRRQLRHVGQPRLFGGPVEPGRHSFSAQHQRQQLCRRRLADQFAAGGQA